MHPIVSICIPAYNNAKSLFNTLESIRIQEFTDYEIIITDDSIDDSVFKMIQNVKLNNIKYYKNKNRLGTPENWNEAIRKSTGKYIKILHHDDLFGFPYSLKKYVELLEQNPSANLAFSASLLLDSKLKETGIHQINSFQVENIKREPELLFLKNIIGAPSATIYRRNEIYFDKELKWLVDVDFYIQLIKNNREIIYTQEPLINIINGLPFQVTQYVKKDKKLIFFENFKLYNKLRRPSRPDYIAHFENLILKYRIYNIAQLDAVFLTDDDKILIEEIISKYSHTKRFIINLCRKIKLSVKKYIIK